MSISIPNTTLPNIAPRRPDVAVTARAMALKLKEFLHRYVSTFFFYNSFTLDTLGTDRQQRRTEQPLGC